MIQGNPVNLHDFHWIYNASAGTNMYIRLFDAWISWFSSSVKSSVELDTKYCFSEELSGKHIFTRAVNYTYTWTCI